MITSDIKGFIKRLDNSENFNPFPNILKYKKKYYSSLFYEISWEVVFPSRTALTYSWYTEDYCFNEAPESKAKVHKLTNKRVK